MKGNVVLGTTRASMTAAIIIKDVSVLVIQLSRGEIQLDKFIEGIIDSGVVNIGAVLLAQSIPVASVPISMLATIGSYYITEKVYSKIKEEAKSITKQNLVEVNKYLKSAKLGIRRLLIEDLPKTKLSIKNIRVLELKFGSLRLKKNEIEHIKIGG